MKKFLRRANEDDDEITGGFGSIGGGMQNIGAGSGGIKQNGWKEGIKGSIKPGI